MTIPAQRDDSEWDIPELVEQLEDRYHTRKLAEEWPNEKPAIQYSCIIAERVQIANCRLQIAQR